MNTLIIPEGSLYVTQSTFQAAKISTLIIANSVTKICTYAYYALTILENLQLPDSLVRIEDYAFYACNTIKTITWKHT
ncbi:MAG: leucine-rich repeat domain-containing protein [Christensenellaceae bacterium]|nr:leucine-rich repeat domain-containing protein [Christensenellaceae bacterium]